MKDKRRLWLASARVGLGINQKELGEKVGVSQASIAGYENGTRTYSGDTALKLSRLFKLPLERFFETA